MTHSPVQPIARPDFQTDAQRVLSDLQAQVNRLVSSLPGPIQRPHELEKALDLDSVLAWKVFQFIETPDVFAAGRFLPGASAFKILLQAARKQSVAKELTEPVARGLSELEELIRVHAGDRVSLDMMMQSLATKGSDAGDDMGIDHRRAAFRGNSFIWGVQAKARFMSMFLSPSAHSHRLDAVMVYGFVDLRRLRPDAPWLLGNYSAKDGQNSPAVPIAREALDPSGTNFGVPILPAFCSQPLPQFRRQEVRPGVYEDEMLGQGMGNTGAMTCTVGEVMRDAFTAVRDEQHQTGTVGVHMSTPSEVLVLDQIVREDVFGPIRPEVKVYGGLRMSAQYPAPTAERFVLPVTERVEYMGVASRSLGTKFIPRYEELGAYVFSRMGWDGNRFDVYRLVMRFPPIPSLVMMRHPLPGPR